MAFGSKLSRQRLRRLQVKTPTGVKWITKKRKPQPAHCANCKGRLRGVPSFNVSDMKNFSKTQRRPERPYGGVLCGTCMKNHFIQKATLLGKGLIQN